MAVAFSLFTSSCTSSNQTSLSRSNTVFGCEVTQPVPPRGILGTLLLTRSIVSGNSTLEGHDICIKRNGWLLKGKQRNSGGLSACRKVGYELGFHR